MQVLVIGDHVDQKSRAFQVMSPSFESFKNHELFVVDIIVEFRAEKVREWNAMGCSSPFDVVIERTVASA